MTSSPQSMDLSQPFIERLSRRQRLARMIILSLFAVTLTGGLVITQINVKRGLIVYSDELKEREIGSTMVIRLEGRSLPFRQPISIESAELRLKDQQGIEVLTQALKPALDSMWQTHVQLPNKEGEYQLIISVEGYEHPSANHGKIPKAPVILNAKTSIHLVKPYVSSPLLPPLAQTPTTARERLGEGTLSFYPMDQRLSSELPSDIAVIAQDHLGKPWSGSATIKLLEGLIAQPMEKTIRFDQQGLAQISVIPRSMSLRLRVEAQIDPDSDEEELSSSDERFNPRAHQFNLYPQSQQVSSQGTLRFNVDSTYRSSKLYVDLWWGPKWLSTQVVNMHDLDRSQQVGGLLSRGQGRIKIPELNAKSPQLLWLQTYQTPYQIDEVRGGAYLLWTPPNYALDKKLEWLLKLSKDLSIEPSAYWAHLGESLVKRVPLLRTLLGRLARPPANPSVLINSELSAELTAKKQRSRYMKLYLEFMAALCAVTMIWLIVLVLLTYRKQIAKPEWSDAGSVQQARRIAISWLAPMMIILIVFFGAMILLVFKISW